MMENPSHQPFTSVITTQFTNYQTGGHRFVACKSCHDSHTACDSARPCRRCVRLGRADSCQNPPSRKRQRKSDDDEEASPSNPLNSGSTMESSMDTSTSHSFSMHNRPSPPGSATVSRDYYSPPSTVISPYYETSKIYNSYQVNSSQPNTHTKPNTFGDGVMNAQAVEQIMDEVKKLIQQQSKLRETISEYQATISALQSENQLYKYQVEKLIQAQANTEQSKQTNAFFQEDQGFAVFDCGGLCIVANQMFLGIMECEPSDLLGMPFSRFADTEDTEKTRGMCLKSMIEGKLLDEMVCRWNTKLGNKVTSKVFLQYVFASEQRDLPKFVVCKVIETSSKYKLPHRDHGINQMALSDQQPADQIAKVMRMWDQLKDLFTQNERYG